jgi:hypothetical protein
MNSNYAEPTAGTGRALNRPVLFWRQCRVAPAETRKGIKRAGGTGVGMSGGRSIRLKKTLVRIFGNHASVLSSHALTWSMLNDEEGGCQNIS